jgi:hypothetical protein
VKNSPSTIARQTVSRFIPWFRSEPLILELSEMDSDRLRRIIGSSADLRAPEPRKHRALMIAGLLLLALAALVASLGALRNLAVILTSRVQRSVPRVVSARMASAEHECDQGTSSTTTFSEDFEDNVLI